MPRILTEAEEKILMYLKEHKTPVMAGTLAKRFIMSQSRVSTLLKLLHEKGLADLVLIGKNKFYKIKD